MYKVIKYMGNLMLAVGAMMSFGKLAHASSQPFPSEKGYILGVGSNYNAFAAGKLEINGGPVHELEGSYAANEMGDSVDQFSEGQNLQWGKLSYFAPIFTTNKLSDDTKGENLRHMIDPNEKEVSDIIKGIENLKISPNNKLIINSLHEESGTWSDTAKNTMHKALMTTLLDKNVGDTEAFGINKDSLIKNYEKNHNGQSIDLDPQAVDAQNYFTAAKDQIENISKYYDSFTTKNDSVFNGSVESVNVDHSSSDNNVTINLKNGYTDKPIVVIKLPKNSTNITVNINNMDTTTQKLYGGKDHDKDPWFASYKNAPYIIFNWDGYENEQNINSTWNNPYVFKINGSITGQTNVENSDGSKATVNQLIASRVLNNFPNLEVSGNNYVTFDQADPNNKFTGTVIAPKANVDIANVGQYFLGSVISGKNIRLENNMLSMRVIAGAFDTGNIRGDDLNNLDPNNLGNINSLSYKYDTDEEKTVTDTADESLKNINGNKSQFSDLAVNLSKVNGTYNLYYWFNQDRDNLIKDGSIQAGDTVHKLSTFKIDSLSDGTFTSKGISSLDTLPDREPATQSLNLDVTRTNILHFALVPDGVTPTAENIEDYTTKSFKLNETGKLSVEVPTFFKFNRTDNSNYVKELSLPATNDWGIKYNLDFGFNSELKTASDGYTLLGNDSWSNFTANDNILEPTTVEDINLFSNNNLIDDKLSVKLAFTPKEGITDLDKKQLPLKWVLQLAS
ncbi:hypothetical protein [Lentilactobacillus laojiaonis]|uniref:hypothetical protein n=1 Tax=Lentilactobacillus laojiaonis TaxID=2883998 RepID=UPI001D0B9E69|nr:hypothetical protein [Lentilactobacillus laojiaonis]UDM32137.1 hypothetical protein LHL71_06315 [Lentilactobacillus laojiaonis]